jgi:hypothetical protein
MHNRTAVVVATAALVVTSGAAQSIEGRKGTRAFMPDDAVKTEQSADLAAKPDSLADCMATWDKATHMTKVEWRATCKRLSSQHWR